MTLRAVFSVLDGDLGARARYGLTSFEISQSEWPPKREEKKHALAQRPGGYHQKDHRSRRCSLDASLIGAKRAREEEGRA